jgi:ABC-type amino acid transport system permease subunit
MKKLDALLSRILDSISDYVSVHRGVPVLLGVLLVVLNYVLLIIPGVQLGFVETTNLLLHVGVIVGLVGVLLGDALN